MAAAWYEEKVREVVDDSEIVDEIFRYFGADQTLDFFHSIATDYGVFQTMACVGIGAYHGPPTLHDHDRRRKA